MIVNNNDQGVCFDVDDTLILWDHPDSNLTIEGISVKAHEKHIAYLKRHHARGHHVTVWSAGGAAWAERAVRLLGIEAFVHEVRAKPRWYVDDIKDPTLWMEHYFYKE